MTSFLWLLSGPLSGPFFGGAWRHTRTGRNTGLFTVQECDPSFCSTARGTSGKLSLLSLLHLLLLLLPLLLLLLQLLLQLLLLLLLLLLAVVVLLLVLLEPHHGYKSHPLKSNSFPPSPAILCSLQRRNGASSDTQSGSLYTRALLQAACGVLQSKELLEFAQQCSFLEWREALPRPHHRAMPRGHHCLASSGQAAGRGAHHET